MFDVNLNASVRAVINSIWRKIDGLSDGDIPAWADEAIIEIERAEKQEGFTICRDSADIDVLLQELARQIHLIDDVYDDLNDPLLADCKARRDRFSIEQNRLMAKAELLRRMNLSSKVSPIKNKTLNRDNRILWLSTEPTALDFIDAICSFCFIPPELDLCLIAQGHFLEQESPKPLLPGFPSPIKWIGDQKVLATLFSSLARDGVIQKRQWKKIAANFVDKDGNQIDPDNLGSLPYKASNQTNLTVEKIRASLDLLPSTTE